MRPAVSVVIPSFNQGKFLQRTVESVLSQQVPDLELAVIDGASTDESVDVLRAMSRTDRRVRWISEPDRGQAHAVNKGFVRTAGEVIGWLNSDDIYYPGAIAAVLKHFRDNPDVDVVYGEGDHIDETDRILDRYPTEYWVPEHLWDRDFLSQPSVFFRRRVVDQCGGLDESLHFALDYEYWLRICRCGMKFAYIPRVLSGTRLHAEAKTVRDRMRIHSEINDMLKSKLGRVPNSWLMNYAFVAADDRMGKMRLLRKLAMLPLALHASWKWNRTLAPSIVGHWAESVGQSAGRALGRRAA